MAAPLTISEIEKFTIVEFQTPTLMDPVVIEEISTAVLRLVDVEDRRRIVLDFERVQFISSQAIGMVMQLRKKLTELPHSTLILCGVGKTLMELLKITNLHKLLTIKPSQREAVKVLVQ